MVIYVGSYININHLFYNLVTSKSDNSTFNKEYAERQIIYLPDKEKVQDVVANGVIR